MESHGDITPLALRLVGQDARSPHPERSNCTGQGSTYSASAAPSPCSTTSVSSTTRLTNYGADMNRDFAVLALLEDSLGREVEHEELRAAIASFALVHNQLPSIRQIALELASKAEEVCGSERYSQGAAIYSNASHGPQLSSPFCARRSEGDAAPSAEMRDEPIFFGPVRALRCNGTHLGLLSHDPLSRLHSPSGRPQQSPSRFAAVDSPERRTPLGSHRQLVPQAPQIVEPLPAPQRQCQASPSEKVGAAPDLVGLQLAPRPFVPGLNLRGLKKKSPTGRGGPSPSTTNVSLSARLHDAPGLAGATASSGPRTPDSCSPTEILRMLLPSACKPRSSVAAAAVARACGRHVLPAAPRSELAAADGAGAATGEGESTLDVRVRQLGCLRISMDDLDQHQSGTRRITPLKTPLAAVTEPAADATPDLTRYNATVTALGSAHDKPLRATPCSRARRHHTDSHYLQDYQHDQDMDRAIGRAGASTGAPAAAVTTLHGSAKRQLLLAPFEQAEAGTSSGARGALSPVDSDLRKDTPSKAQHGGGSATAAAVTTTMAVTAARFTAATCMTVGETNLTAHCPRTGCSPLRGPSAESESGASLPQPIVQQQQDSGTVLQHQLPAAGSVASALGAGSSHPSARHRVWSASSARFAVGASVRVPPLALGGGFQQPGQGRGLGPPQHGGPLPTGARTRRLSICVPSAMVYGEGPLTTRRVVAAASAGVTSHALCTVFWAESEDELDMNDDTESYDSDELDQDDCTEHGDPNSDFSRIAKRALLGHSAAAAQAQDLVISAVASAAAAAGVAMEPPPGSPRSSQMTVARYGPRLPAAHGARGRRRGGARRRCDDNPDAEELDPDSCGGGLMLPEQLWDAWERLSDGPKGRQYRLLESLTHVERITCTSYSTVSKACHQGQPVVVKIYDVAERDKLANAFAEIGVLLHLAGWSGAVRLLDYGRHEDKVMLMLESCDHSLKDWCDSQRYDTATGTEYIVECLRLWCTLAELLTELHEHWHVAHCDLKPGNVLLSGGRLRLADFSESMLFNETPVLQDQARGTVPYQPPEMVHGHCVDARKADVWAVGCILYEMITGELLFKGNSDCMRAVAAGSAAARLRLRHRQRSGRIEQRQQRPNQLLPQKPQSRDAPVLAAVPQPPPPPLHWDLVQSGPAQAALALWAHGAEPGAAVLRAAEGPEAGRDADADAPAVASMPPPPPRVPKLPLAQTRGPAAAGSPWQGHLPAAASGGGYLQPPLGLPPHFLMASGAGSAMATGRSLELIAEGCCGAEDASSLTSDPWVAPSVANTAPTTARSTARSQIPQPYHNEYYQYTARSFASTSTAGAGAGGGPGWPPAPPPSTGTARSVADSEWTLAMPTTTATTGVGVGFGFYSRSCAGAGLSSNCSGAGAYGSGVGEAAVDGTAAAPTPPPPSTAALLPPHRRLRHSVATQCADPAGPDWLATEEADRLRIMCDEPPSFLQVQCFGGNSATASAGGGHLTGGSAGGQSDGGSGMAAAVADLCTLYQRILLSGANGPTLCDDVLGLLRAVLVEDHARPSMRQVAALAAEVLRRHCPAPEPVSEEDSHGAVEEVLAAADNAPTASAGRNGKDTAMAEGELNDRRVAVADLSFSTGPGGGGEGAAGGGPAAAAPTAQATWYSNSVAEPLGHLPLPAAGTVAAANHDEAEEGDYPEGSMASPRPAAAGVSFPPRLCLSVLQERPSSCHDRVLSDTTPATTDGGGGGVGGAWGGPPTGGTDGGSWAGSSSFGDEPAMDLSCGGGGGGGTSAAVAIAAPDAAAAADGSGACDNGATGRSVSLFDICQPLVTTRAYSRSWQRFLTKPS